MRIAQISDTHMTASAPGPGGYDSGAALQAVLERLDRLRPDVILLTGDLAADGLPEEYGRLCEIIGGFGVPIAAIPGNHDRRAAFVNALAPSEIAIGEGPCLWVAVEDGPVRLLGLDTIGANDSPDGLIGDAQLAWVADRLAGKDRRPVLVFMHHPPFRLGLPMDPSRCHDGDDLARVLIGHRRVLGATCGHVHRTARIGWAGTIGSVCPSVAWEIPLDLAPDGEILLVRQSPAFQLHIFDPELGLVTHTEYVMLPEATNRATGSPATG